MSEPVQSVLTHQELRKRKIQHGGMHRPTWAVLEIEGRWFAAHECPSAQAVEIFIRKQIDPKKVVYDLDDE